MRLQTIPYVLVTLSVNAQSLPPVVTPRGVVNAYSQQLAPSVASPGSVIWIQGLNLGPTPEVKATGLPLPKLLGDLEVLVNDRPAALYSASLGKVVAQVPYETLPGLATVIVRRGDQRSRPARINIVASLPSIRTQDDKGYGPIAGFTVTGLGPTDPPLADGEASAAAPRAPVKVYIGGWPVNAVATHTTDQPGIFNLQLEVPTTALLSEAVVLLQNGRRSNAAVLSAMSRSEVQFMRLPDGTPELRTILSSDLRASYIAATGARAPNGCYTGIVLDLAKQTTAKLPDCLASDTPNAPTPFQQAVDGTALAAFIGPGRSQSEVSDQVLLLNATKSEPINVKLPSTSQLLVSAPEGNFAAVQTGSQAVMIDSDSGEVRPFDGPLAGAGLMIGGGGLGGAIGVGIPAIDLGDGLNKVLTQPMAVGNATRLAVVGDSDDPTKAKVAAINQQNAVTQTRDFPEGWLPLAAPAPQLLGPNAGILNRLPVSATFDAPQRTYYVLARKADNSRHGLVAVRTDRNEVHAIEFPDGWFAAACTPNIRFFGVELVRRIGLLASVSADRAFNLDCPASGFLLFDLDEQKVTTVTLPGAGEFSATTGTDEMNDYIFGSNTDPSRQGSADTLYVLDGVTATAFRMDLPAGLAAFANLRAVPAMSLLIGLGRSRQPGDSGLVVFDLERGQSTTLPTPDGFTAVQIVDVFPATRQVVARGTKQGNTGTQLLVYDLVTSELQIVENPAGVAFVGAPAAVPAGPPTGPGGGMMPLQQQGVNLRANLRANAVLAITYDAERKQNGVLALRVH